MESARLSGAVEIGLSDADLLTVLRRESNTTTASPEDDLANFGDTINILGLMDRTDQDFVDGLALDLISPLNRTLVVQQNTSPLSGSFVTGSNGEPFMALSNYSWVISVNETANDLIAKIELPYDPEILSQMGIDQSNTYVGTLAADKKSWIISESQRNVHISENKTRIIKMTSIAGEYMLLGRMTLDTANIFVQYGQGPTRTVNVTGGPGVQEAEFIDGLRFSMQSINAFTMNVELRNGIQQAELPGKASSLIDSFAWVINTTGFTQPSTVEMRVPFNRAMFQSLRNTDTPPTDQLLVAKRPLEDTTGQFVPLIPENQEVINAPEDRIRVPGITDIDGQYVVLVMNSDIITNVSGVAE
ncbi:hypothetical protein K432DRAFT_301395 [Lepidopterella palustris CBS 459.81]|uniref:Uncharacterized protein n=1 Tax=Lepidopterella palustris CBS 459.81 TaxID=1314670 RepID=A0A8E2JDS1_9PEZI|nr:hypothetical protein K432DRAFT_301395 [Lepidopterella palustris CBS 459.81]